MFPLMLTALDRDDNGGGGVLTSQGLGFIVWLGFIGLGCI